MINGTQNIDEIKTNADAGLRGFELQKYRAAERLLQAVREKKRAVCICIEGLDDIDEREFGATEKVYRTEQDKLYQLSFSMNSDSVLNSLRIFFDNWRALEQSESISFVFYTNTKIAKEKKAPIINDQILELPKEPLIQLLIEKKYDEALPYIKPIFRTYYTKQHAKHIRCKSPTVKSDADYERVINLLTDEDWKTFLGLIEWNFEAPDIKAVKRRGEEITRLLCIEKRVSSNYASAIYERLLNRISSGILTNDYLEKVVFVSDVELLFCEALHEEIISIMSYEKRSHTNELSKLLHAKDRSSEYYGKWKETVFLNRNTTEKIKLNELYTEELIPNAQLIYPNNHKLVELTSIIEDNDNKCILILGAPGAGKSTLITYYLANGSESIQKAKVFKWSDIQISMQVTPPKRREYNYCINGVELDWNSDFFEGQTIFLDGFDELGSIEGERYEVLADIRNKKRDSCRLIVTCRKNYIYNHLHAIPDFCITEITNWEATQCEKYIENYKSRLTENPYSERYATLVRLIKQDKSALDVLGIPLLLYMVVALPEIDLTFGENGFSSVKLYDRIFDKKGGIFKHTINTQYGSKAYDKGNREPQESDVENCYEMCKEIALWIFEHDPNRAVFNIVDGKVSVPSWNADALHFSLFRDLHITEGGDLQELEFVHRSVYQYFVVAGFSQELRKSYVNRDIREAILVMGKYFSLGEIDEGILLFLREKIKIDFEQYLPGLFEWWKVLFKKFLEGGLEKGVIQFLGKYINDPEEMLRKKNTLLEFNMKHIVSVHEIEKYIIRKREPRDYNSYVMDAISKIYSMLFQMIGAEQGNMLKLGTLESVVFYQQGPDVIQNIELHLLSNTNYLHFENSILLRDPYFEKELLLRDITIVNCQLKSGYVNGGACIHLGIKYAKIMDYNVKHYSVMSLQLVNTLINNCNIESLRCESMEIQNVKFTNCHLHGLAFYRFKEVHGIDFEETDITGISISPFQARQKDIRFENADFEYIYVGKRRQKYNKSEFLETFRQWMMLTSQNGSTS